jgi:hypothetical protein
MVSVNRDAEPSTAQYRLVRPLHFKRQVGVDPAMTNQDLGRGVWYDPVETGYIALDVTADIPARERQKRILEGTALFPKDEYHCSLVAVRKYTDDREYEGSVANAVRDYLFDHDLRYSGLDDERYLCRKDDRVTVVAPVRLGGIEEFLGFVRTLVPGYQRPFPHVTLLTSGTAQRGISVNSTDDLRRYCRRIVPDTYESEGPG